VKNNLDSKWADNVLTYNPNDNHTWQGSDMNPESSTNMNRSDNSSDYNIIDIDASGLKGYANKCGYGSEKDATGAELIGALVINHGFGHNAGLGHTGDVGKSGGEMMRDADHMILNLNTYQEPYLSYTGNDEQQNADYVGTINDVMQGGKSLPAVDNYSKKAGLKNTDTHKSNPTPAPNSPAPSTSKPASLAPELPGAPDNSSLHNGGPRF